jgi:hypothetical protein
MGHISCWSMLICDLLADNIGNVKTNVATLMDASKEVWS